jgi:hypothetical protein
MTMNVTITIYHEVEMAQSLIITVLDMICGVSHKSRFLARCDTIHQPSELREAWA